MPLREVLRRGKRFFFLKKKRLGGVCLNEGCIPTKTLLNSAKLYDHAKGGRAFGVTAKEVSVDIRAVLERKQKVIDQLVSGVGMTMRRNKITVISEHAQIKGEAEEGFLVEAGEKPMRHETFDRVGIDSDDSSNQRSEKKYRKRICADKPGTSESGRASGSAGRSGSRGCRP